MAFARHVILLSESGRFAAFAHQNDMDGRRRADAAQSPEGAEAKRRSGAAA
jgi:hypothetical protein